MELEAGLLPDQVAQGQREAVDAVRRVMANLPPVPRENPLGLPLDREGQVPSSNIQEIPGEERQARFDRGNQFCRYLNGREGWVAAFDRLPHFHQILAIILAENVNQHPHVVKDRFLSFNNDYRVLAIT